MIRPALSLAFFVLCAATAPALAQHSSHSNTQSPYAGFEAREVTSLSESDLAELRRGGGWGLALPAELNGYPGPAHLLELKEKIPLSPAQTAEIQALFDQMRQEAIAAGERFIAAETALDAGFRTPGLTRAELEQLLQAAAEARAALRLVHLSRHLLTSEILSQDQIETYNALRGYTQDPCLSVPEGHDAQMWRKHNGCV